MKNAVGQPQASTVRAEVRLAFDLLPWPLVDFAKLGPIERVELSKIKKISGANLMRNAIVIPHVTNFDEVDITDLEAFRVAGQQGRGQQGCQADDAGIPDQSERYRTKGTSRIQRVA